MKMEKVSSSHIDEIGHDDKETLAVKFKNGKLYHYDGVSPVKYLELKSAKSIGGHLHSKIFPHHTARKPQ